jgi:hypothetical protein
MAREAMRLVMLTRQAMDIVVTGSMPFTAEQVRRLQRVGRLTLAGSASCGAEWLEQVEGADVVCSDGRFVAGNLERLHDVFVTFPFVEIGSVDTDALARRNVVLANARGSNRDAVVESRWPSTHQEPPVHREGRVQGRDPCRHPRVRGHRYRKERP